MVYLRNYPPPTFCDSVKTNIPIEILVYFTFAWYMQNLSEGICQNGTSGTQWLLTTMTNFRPRFNVISEAAS